MTHDTYKYRFDESVPARELEDTFLLAILTVESLHGRSRVRMESRFNLDKIRRTCAEIAEGKHEFKTIVVDTVDNAYKMCPGYVCKKFKIEHESGLGYGKGYALINNEFQRVINKLAFLSYGLILISHSQERDIETRIGKHTRIVPTLPEGAIDTERNRLLEPILGEISGQSPLEQSRLLKLVQERIGGGVSMTILKEQIRAIQKDRKVEFRNEKMPISKRRIGFWSICWWAT